MNQLRLEDALWPSDRVFLMRYLELMGIELSEWSRAEPLRLVFESLAIEAEAERLRSQRPELSRRGSICAACVRLGIDPDTYSRRVREWRRLSRGGVKRLTRGAA